MNQKSDYIKQRLSLRKPLRTALDIIVELEKELEFKKEINLKEELAKVKNQYPTCKDFERAFPSVCFSIATGVGKTRLMGACIAFLHLQRGIRNFFVLAPNITIYEKLIRDFGDPGYEKYVFSGISEFVHNRPIIITGDNYNHASGLFSETEIRINIFNISKFNRDTSKITRGQEAGMLPRIKRLSEYLGQSYWDYLSNLKDLVILMDEAHRYHADASKNAIDELKPVFGIELTATPLDEEGKAFKNVVYEYSLAQALADGLYVKNPAIATRKNFRMQGLSPKEVENIKLEDAISVHENTRNELELYALNNNVNKVKPFILVVCRDTTHAREVFEYINSADFFKGRFMNKVLQIDSTTRNTEDIEKQFLTLEQEENEIEIVIHVNMLKEGWDVTNLYTIVPLRAANAPVLVEQTIGRGLRLPYKGERTGVDKVDKLTVIAHDNFEAVIEAAKDPNSVLNKLSYIELDDDDLGIKTEVVASLSKTKLEIATEEKKIESIKDETEKQEARNKLDAKKFIIEALPTFSASDGIRKASDLEKPEAKKIVIGKIQQELSKGQLNAFAGDIIEEAKQIYETVVTSFRSNLIEIPRMDLVQEDIKVWFDDFDLDTSKGFDFKVLDEEIIIRGLKDDKTETIGVLQGAFTRDTPVNQVISELINYPEIDYDENADLLHKLSTQAVNYLKDRLDGKENLDVLIKQYKKIIAFKLYDQLKQHFKISEPDYIEPKVLPFVKIEDWNFTMVQGGYKDYRDLIKPPSSIKKYVFRGFEKACHFEYKFDSKTEKDFAYILENDKSVKKWMRPAPNQFRIYWSNNSRQYLPDFLVETEEVLYLIETKALDQLNAPDVMDKKKAALNYCRYATQYTTTNGGKPWKYLLIPHNEVGQEMGFEYFAVRFIQK